MSTNLLVPSVGRACSSGPLSTILDRGFSGLDEHSDALKTASGVAGGPFQLVSTDGGSEVLPASFPLRRLPAILSCSPTLFPHRYGSRPPWQTDFKAE